MLTTYKHVTIVNLLQNTRTYEKKLTDELEALLNMNKGKYQNNVYYVDFDFHTATKGNRYHKVDILVEQIDDLINYYEYFS
jgi:hypothetical protein